MVKVIIDTDMLTDCDDAGAIAMAHALCDDKEMEILGIVTNGEDGNKKHGAVVSAINYYFNRPEIPIGTAKYKDMRFAHSPFSASIFDKYPNDKLLDTERPDAIDIYRQILSEADDHSITIVSIGHLYTIEDLLKSPGDKYNAQSGLELIKTKVKELILTGGNYPNTGEEKIRCHNFSPKNDINNTTAKSTKYVFTHWPEDVPVIFSGGEIGINLWTGKGYQNAPNSPMVEAYKKAYDAINLGRPSWDQTAILYAARGLSFNNEVYWNVEDQGYCHIFDDGLNEWRSSPNKNQAYLIQVMDKNKMEELIESFMLRTPKVSN